MKYRTSQYQRFSNKKEKYQTEVVSKNGKQKSIKKEIRTKELNLCPYILYYCNLNVTGTLYLTRTAAPFCLPGIHFGISATTRNAS